MPDTNIQAKDLTKEAPRSPYDELHGFAILPRTIDKCRAAIAGTIGEYHFDCPLDNVLFSFKDIKGDDFKAYVAEGHDDDEIAEWVMANGKTKTPDEIEAWSERFHHDYSYSDGSNGPEKKAWFEGECKRLGLEPEKVTLFDMLEVDDLASFKQK